MSSDYKSRGLDDPLDEFKGLSLDDHSDDYNNPLGQIILKVGKDKLTISKRDAMLSNFLESALMDPNATEIDIMSGNLATLKLVVKFLEEYKGETPQESRLSAMSELVSGKGGLLNFAWSAARESVTKQGCAGGLPRL